MATDTYASYTLKRYRIGDTWKGLVFSSVTVDDAAPPNELTAVQVQMRLNGKTGTIKETLTVGSGITIDNAANWGFTLDEQVLSGVDEPGTYFFDIRTTDSAGDVKTYLECKMLVVVDI